MRGSVILIAAASVCLTSACAGDHFHNVSIGGSSSLATDADLRLVTATSVDQPDGSGHFKPKQVLCAEPSPDVARAVGQAFNAGITVKIEGQGANLPADAQAQIAGAISTARSEALAQLTERLPTIQLLRDGLYRACEAYANGALSPISYALLLSRYGDTMVTMLGSELIAGDFGRQLAAISSTAGGESGSTLSNQGSSSTNTQKSLDQTGADLAAKTREVNKANEAVAAAAGSTPADQQAAQQNADRKIDEQAQLQQSFNTQLAATAKSNTSATATAGAALVAQNIGADRGRIIGRMQRDYILTPSLSAVLVACITALDRTDKDSAETEFEKLCKQGTAGNGILLTALSATQSQITSMIANESEAKALPLVRDTIERAVQVQNDAKLLNPPAKQAASPQVNLDEQIRAVQTALKAKGLYAGKVDGIAGAATTAAIGKFQKSLGLAVTGLLDPPTVAKLLPASS